MAYSSFMALFKNFHAFGLLFVLIMCVDTINAYYNDSP